MPKKIQFETIEENKKYQFNSEIRFYLRNTFIRVPPKVSEAFKDKKVKVTIELLEEIE